MSTDGMMERITETSPRFKARIADVFYLLMMLPGGLARYARGGLFVTGDAAAFERATGRLFDRVKENIK
jgi:hypothetical protein